MKNITLKRELDAAQSDAAGDAAGDAEWRFTPADFFRDAGAFIAVCLALGLLAQLLLGQG